jgi:asparagine synthase (glutamine-hydrolysing)
VSGFAAIANLDGRPVDEGVVREMAAQLAAMGPDDTQMWIGGWNRNVALVHAKFATTEESEGERQPITVDGNAWLAGDVRIDAREELWPELEGRGVHAARHGGDAALVLHAYGAWGPSCVEHLLGDFSFAAWDERNRRLVCARDQMGVRPFYYHQAGDLVVCSNSLECVLLHPGVPEAINEEAFVEFLLFGENTNLRTTIYRGVQRLPPAHRLMVSSAGAAVERYWTFPVEEPVYYRRDAEYGDRLRTLVDAAVRDRLRTPKVAVFMSGGLDSSTLAAVASRHFQEPANHVVAHTIVVEGPEPDAEPQFVDQIARHLGIKVHYRRKGAAFYDSQWQARDLACPEPNCQQFSHHEAVQYYGSVAEGTRVAYWGEGPDNALAFEWRPHLRYLARRGRWLRALGDIAKYVAYSPNLPSRAGVCAALGRDDSRENSLREWYPPWLRPQIEEKYELRRRWLDTYARFENPHQTRPQAYAGLTDHTFPNMCEQFDPGWHRTPLEFRHPYLDVRVLRFMLTLPAVPWCRNKLVMRKAAEPLLPAACVSRPKAPVQGQPWQRALAGQAEPSLLNREQMQEYVDPDKVKVREQSDVWGFALAQNVFAVDYWLAKRATRRSVQTGASGRKDVQW